MSSHLRPRALPQCSACVRSYLTAGFGELTTSTTVLRQQVRGKATKKPANTSNTVPVRLLKDVKTFGRRGAIVPISHGQMRNDWFPRHIAEYVTAPELKTLRLKNATMDRDFDFGLAALVKQAATTLSETAKGAMSATQQQDASMFQKKAVAPERLSAERSLELLEIFVPGRLDFWRPPIIEEKEVEATPVAEAKRSAQSYGFGAGAELMAARAQQASAPAPKPKLPVGPQAVYGSVSTHDILIAARAAMGRNDEAKMVVLREEDVRFVDLVGSDGSGETDRVKQVGDFVVEIKVRGSEESVRKNVRVIAQEAGSGVASQTGSAAASATL